MNRAIIRLSLNVLTFIFLPVTVAISLLSILKNTMLIKIKSQDNQYWAHKDKIQFSRFYLNLFTTENVTRTVTITNNSYLLKLSRKGNANLKNKIIA